MTRIRVEEWRRQKTGVRSRNCNFFLLSAVLSRSLLSTSPMIRFQSFRHSFRLTPRINPAVTPVRRRPSLDFSLTGLVYCSMMMFMGLAAINTQANLLFGVFGLMIGILLVSGIISRLVLRRVRIQRDLPEHGIVGRPMTITYHFSNGKKFWPSLSISLAELGGVEGFVRQPLSYLLHAAAGTTATVPVEVVPKRRGLHSLGRYQISTSFPFGFIKRAVERIQNDALVVYPAVARVDSRLMSLCQPAEKTGPTMRPKRGGMDEFYGLKEHRQGENTAVHLLAA